MKIYQKNLTEMKQIVDDYTSATVDPQIVATVAEIIQTVRQEGDAALRNYGAQFDKVDVKEFAVPQTELEAAYQTLPSNLKDALATAKANITSFHQQEIENGFADLTTPGVVRGQKVTPLARVGLYVPGGTAAYPSTILMNAIPAKLAGVGKLVMVTPPQREGISQTVLAAAYLAGVDAVYQVGGAQAIAALAYGTESIPQVDKIVGPGNIFVATAKQQVFGQVAIDMVAAVSRQVFMPLTVGGGIRSVEDMRALLLAGADKVSLNSSAVADPDLISAGARLFGNQCLVTAIDVKTDPATGQKMVYTHGGTKPTGLEALAWAKQVVSLGSGELLVTSMDKDGTQDGYDTAFYKELTAAVDVPVIASGGAGKIDDFADVFLNSGVTGALAASVFHFQQLTIAQVKEDLIKKGVPVRWNQTLQRGS